MALGCAVFPHPSPQNPEDFVKDEIETFTDQRWTLRGEYPCPSTRTSKEMCGWEVLVDSTASRRAPLCALRFPENLPIVQWRLVKAATSGWAVSTASVGLVHENEWIPPYRKQFTAFWVVTDRTGGTWWASLAMGGYREMNGRFTKFDFPFYETNGQPILIGLDRPERSGFLANSATSYAETAHGVLSIFQAASPGSIRRSLTPIPHGRLWLGYREKAILLIDGTVLRVLSAKDGLRVAPWKPFSRVVR